jgi:transcriptional regulator with XRE-family HTH domain
MLNQLGRMIRASRNQKGISINDYAAKLGVSVGYLSNLETGKTDTINLSILEKLQEELHLFPLEMNNENIDDQFNLRVQRVGQMLNKLNHQKSDEAEYLLSVVEKGIELFKKESL